MNAPQWLEWAEEAAGDQARDDEQQRGKCIDLPPWCGLPRQVHVFERDSVYAVNAALAAQRPLLLRGEPGTGKSQLARAAAVGLRRMLVHQVIDARTESTDLLYRFDAIARLAEAQVQGAGKSVDRDRLAETNFLTPGPLWWAINSKTASEYSRIQPEKPHEQSSPGHGWVVLLDEIDKADTDVPNGLLEALDSKRFDPPGIPEGVIVDRSLPPPLVIVTTNEERALPDAFLRRCLVLHLSLPEDGIVDWLVQRGQGHFPGVSDRVLREAAEQLGEDRDALRGRGHALPGQAEYLDLIRAVSTQRKSEGDQLELLRQVRRFVFDKHGEGGGK